MYCIYMFYRAQGRIGPIRDSGAGVGKKDGKSQSRKDSQLVLRLDKEERDAFVDLCKELDTSAAREIRGFIRRFMKKNQSD